MLYPKDDNFKEHLILVFLKLAYLAGTNFSFLTENSQD